MKSKDDSMKWIPLWVDKWLFGSTRLELQHDERAIWVDLMALAGKDNGFVRANAETPYQKSQMAGLLCAPEELLTRTIERCIATGKIVEDKPGIYYLVNWNDFRLSTRQRQRIESKAKERSMASKSDTMSQLSATTSQIDALNKEKRREEKSKEEEEKVPISVFYECEFFKIKTNYHDELVKEFPLINFNDLYARLRNDCHDNPLRYKKNVRGHIKNLRNVLRNWCQREKPTSQSEDHKPKTAPIPALIECKWCGTVYPVKDGHECP